MKLKMPKFKSEEEEANWWYDNREEHSKLMLKAIANGERTTLAEILERRRKKLGATPTVSIRIDPIDIARARKLATKKGLPYQTLLKTLIREALSREERRMAS
jgi:predicted DNA binding CopG/RHH family protein